MYYLNDSHTQMDNVHTIYIQIYIHRHGWELMPRFGGGDMFSLRRKKFVYEVINE